MNITAFVNGAIMMEFIIAAVFFLRFWKRTHDQLFLMFAVAFALMAVNRVFLDIYAERGTDNGEHRTLIYCVRLLAFAMFLFGILLKNRRRSVQQI